MAGEAADPRASAVNELLERRLPRVVRRNGRAGAAEYGLEIEVWNEKKLADERCGSLLAVNQGSVRQPRVVICRWNGGKEGVPAGDRRQGGHVRLRRPVAQAVRQHGRTMKYDMGGAAVARHAGRL